MNKYTHKTVATAQKVSVYSAGKEAFKAGRGRGQNPYAANNLALAAIWWNGWDTGEEESKSVQSGKKKP